MSAVTASNSPVRNLYTGQSASPSALIIAGTHVT